MSEKTYCYKGPDSAISVTNPKSTKDKPLDDVEVLLRDGKQVKLPDDSDAVKTLVAMGHLEEVPQVADVASTEDIGKAGSKTARTS